METSVLIGYVGLVVNSTLFVIGLIALGWAFWVRSKMKMESGK